MRRADRLFQIVQILRSRRLTTAAYLAEMLEISERSIYRDIQDLLCSGVPINGEAGRGYVLEPGFDFPPLMFTQEELQTLMIGMRLASQCGDRSLRQSAEQIIAKVDAVLPAQLKPALERTVMDVPLSLLEESTAATLAVLRRAAGNEQKVQFQYCDENNASSERIVRPLELAFWGKVWTLVSWCELRNDFRNFRLDRISNMTLLDQYFSPEPGKTVENYYRKLQQQIEEKNND